MQASPNASCATGRQPESEFSLLADDRLVAAEIVTLDLGLV
jgi:hypothetical protein